MFELVSMIVLTGLGLGVLAWQLCKEEGNEKVGIKIPNWALALALVGIAVFVAKKGLESKLYEKRVPEKKLRVVQ